VIETSAPDRYATRLPILLGRAQEARAAIPLPASTAIPPDFVFIPGGVSLVGAADVEAVRKGLRSEPEHPVRVEAFLIGAHEVTFGEYLEFLGSLPGAERDARASRGTGLALLFDRDGVPSLTIGATTARRGEPFCRPKRSERRCQDWQRFPVAGIEWEDAEKYIAWLTARVPGARFCSGREWERATRGADGRLYASADTLHPGDADLDAAYGRNMDQMGVDEVASFPADRSPFGVFDLTGNVREFAMEGSAHLDRGGSWDDDWYNARAVYRASFAGKRSVVTGFRVCSSLRETP
jgi:formylglycine-generating enzyme required for sulfatase activity